MARTNVMLKKDKKGGGEVGAPVQGAEERDGRERMEAPLTSAPPIPSQEALTCKGGEEDGRGREVGRGGKMAGGCVQVTIIVANPTVGPDGCRGWAI